MRILALTSLIGLAFVAVGCDNGSDVVCGTGTHLDTDGKTCVEDTMTPVTCGPNATLSADGKTCSGPDFAGSAPSCGQNQVLNAMTNKCELTSAACLNGTVLSADKLSCTLNTDHGSLVAGPFTSDKIWAFLRYSNGSTLQPLGDFYQRTATVGANAEIYLNPAPSPIAPGPTDPNVVPKMGHTPVDTTSDTTRTSATSGWPVFWDANPGNPSSTPSAFDHVITVGEWDTCTQTWSIYKNPPGIGGKHYYRLVVDYAGCPANSTFELWFNYGNGANGAMRILGTPAGGLPNSAHTLADGTGHWERDFDPNVWTKSNVALNGNTHSAMGSGVPATSKGSTPNLTVSPDASFWIATFFHNSGQSNGNAGWCAAPDGTAPGTETVCGIPYQIGSKVSNPATVTSTAYIYLPGKVGFESIPVFASGATPGVTNAAPLSALQPY